MVSTSITPETMTLVDRPGPLYRVGAILMPLVGLLVAAWIAYLVVAPPVVAIDCSRPRSMCELQVGGRVRSVKLSELTSARVSEHRVSKVGTLYQLELVGGGTTHVLGKQTSHAETVAQLRSSAAALSTFLGSTHPTLSLSWRQRVGFSEMLGLTLMAGTLVLNGAVMLGIWARSTIIVDRTGRRVTLIRTGPLRSRRKREIAIDDVRELRQHTDRDRTRIELVIGDREVWPAIAREPSSGPGVAAARIHLEQAFGRAVRGTGDL